MYFGFECRDCGTAVARAGYCNACIDDDLVAAARTERKLLAREQLAADVDDEPIPDDDRYYAND